MKKPRNKNDLRLLLLMTFIFLAGCSGGKIRSHWRQETIAVNGNAGEWRYEPRIVDKKTQVSVHAANDAEALYLCISTGDETLKTRLMIRGITIWVDPGGGKKKILGLYLPGIPEPPGPRPRSPGSKPGVYGPPEGFAPFVEREFAPSSPVPLREMEITYEKATGPLKMTMEEVRRTGVDAGAGKSDDGKLIYEFKFEYNAAPCLAELKPGATIGIGIVAGRSRRDTLQKRGPGANSNRGGPGGGGMGGPGRNMGGLPGGGGMGGGMGPRGGGGRGPMVENPDEKGDFFETWIKVKLAGLSSM